MFALHAVFAARYGLTRDELYFLACARHLDWGFVDMPSVVPALAWIALGSGAAVFALHTLAGACVAAAVYLTCRLTERLGGGSAAQLLAGIVAAASPLLLLTGSMLFSTTLEPLTWTVLALIFLRLLQTRDDRWWIAAGAALGITLWIKYTILTFFAGFVVALLVSDRQRAVSRRFLFGLMLAALVIAPNAAWQIAHGLPMLGVIHADVDRAYSFTGGIPMQFTGLLGAAEFLAGNVLLMGIPGCIVAVAGWRALLKDRTTRSLGITVALLVVFGLAMRERAYYISGLYPLLFAAGAVHVERNWPARSRTAVLAAVLVVTLPLLPFLAPVLPLNALVAYSQALHLEPRADARIMEPLFAEEVGWRRAVEQVAQVYNALPAPQRARTAIFADSYAYAGAIDFYGSQYGLPPAISGADSYWWWGTRGYDGASMIAVGATDYALLKELFGSVQTVAVVRDESRGLIEGPLPVYLCSRPVRPLAELWPRLRYYGP